MYYTLRLHQKDRDISFLMLTLDEVYRKIAWAHKLYGLTHVEIIKEERH